MKRAVIPYDFKAFGQAIKAARMAKGESRKNVSDDMNISPRYLANIENKGQQPSLQIFYELVTRYHISVAEHWEYTGDGEKIYSPIVVGYFTEDDLSHFNSNPEYGYMFRFVYNGDHSGITVEESNQIKSRG